MTQPSDPSWRKSSKQTRGPQAGEPELRLQEANTVSRFRKLVAVGIALSAERRLDHLLDLIVQEAMALTHADGGALYTADPGRRNLDFAIIQNRTLNLRMGGTGEGITWPPVPLYDSDGEANHRNVSAYCALVQETVNIADVYEAEGFDFDGTRAFDRKNGYRSRSMLVLPMVNHEDEVIGVLQLVNAMDPDTGEVVPFSDSEIPTVGSLASQAAVALVNVQLLDELQNLLESFIRSIAQAIDEKSPFTGGHIKRVADLAIALAREVSAATTGPFAEHRFSEDQMDELRVAAWMHDVGKVSTPEYVVDKSTKLETLFDRMELLRHRFEILKRDVEIRHLREQLQRGVGSRAESHIRDAAYREEMRRIEAARAFIEKINMGGETLETEKIEHLRTLAEERFLMNETENPLLSPEELENLSVRRGTLTARERAIINQHVELTIRMLESLPFPKKYRNVPLIAGAHHEKLDGSGYPRGVTAEKIPLQARVLAVADVFEALTAADRPYRKGRPLSEAVRILEAMVAEEHLDGALCDLLIKTGLAARYAGTHLASGQLDPFAWDGVTYFPGQHPT